ncbi:ribonuclease H-like domain-containing protein [Tanacetum coccineum]
MQLNNDLRTIKLGSMSINEYFYKIRRMADLLLTLMHLLMRQTWSRMLLTVSATILIKLLELSVIRRRPLHLLKHNLCCSSKKAVLLVSLHIILLVMPHHQAWYLHVSPNDTRSAGARSSGNTSRVSAQHCMGYAPDCVSPQAATCNAWSGPPQSAYPNSSNGILGPAPSNVPLSAFGPTRVQGAVAHSGSNWGPQVVYGPYRDQATTLLPAFNAMTVQDFGDANWYMDTGATSHLASDAEDSTSLTSLRLLTTPSVTSPPDNNNIAPTGTNLPGPTTPMATLRDPNWQHAMQDEFNALITNDGSLSRYKARLVANGRNQQQGIDCDETFSPVVKLTTIRTVLIYMHQPPGFTDHAHPDYVCLLQKSLYGLKQAPRAWFQRFASYAIRVGFRHSRTDSSLFIYHRGSETAYLLLYVDDIILTASSSTLLQHLISSLNSEFVMTDLGLLNYFLGISAHRTTNGLFLSQTKYAKEILERAHMLNYNPYKTPVNTESKLGPDGDPVEDPILFRSLAGALQYLTFTRPDLSYAVQQICLFMHDPREPYYTALKRILRYVCGTLDHGLQLYYSHTSQLIAYSDADWVGCPSTRRSTLGYCVFLGDNLITWSSKRQHVISRSSTEAEYRGVASAVAETTWVRNLLRELLVPLHSATLVYCDNVSTVYLSSNPVQHQRTKHIEIDIHFVRDLVTTGHVRVLHVPSRYQHAGIFTKGRPSPLFTEFCSSLNVRPPPAQTVGAY